MLRKFGSTMEPDRGGVSGSPPTLLCPFTGIQYFPRKTLNSRMCSVFSCIALDLFPPKIRIISTQFIA